MDYKPYDEMTEQERKDKYGFCFKGQEIEGHPKQIWCHVNVDDYINNTVFSKGTFFELENDPNYHYDDAVRYMTDYPEQVVLGWKAPYNNDEKLINSIRTEWVIENTEEKDHLKLLFENLRYKFIDDDPFIGFDYDRPLIEYNNSPKTCDEMSLLASQYLGDDSVKYDNVVVLRNEGKNYIREAIETLYREHGGNPGELLPYRYMN